MGYWYYRKEEIWYILIIKFYIVCFVNCDVYMLRVCLLDSMGGKGLSGEVKKKFIILGGFRI